MMVSRALSWTEKFSAPVVLSSPVLVLASVVLTVVVLIVQALILPVEDALAGCFLVPVLVWASAVDIERHILPNALVIPLIGLGLLRSLTGYSGPDFVEAAIGASVGYGFLAFFSLFYRMRSGTEGLGFGDVKLFSAAGAWLGWSGLPHVMLLAASLALLPYAVGFVRGDRNWRRRAIAFGPFISFALWLIWLGRSWQAQGG